VLLKRVHKRGIGYERGMAASYLKSLCDAYTQFFHFYNQAPLLIVNAAEINLVDSESDYLALVKQIAQVKSGRHYFNPMPDALRVEGRGEADV
jgi:deoxyadenosine/deoxycytidine kinase